MKNYLQILIVIMLIITLTTLTSCVKTANKAVEYSPIPNQLETEQLQDVKSESSKESSQESSQENPQEMIIDIDTIINHRDSYKEQKTPTIEEIGEENLANYLFQQFNKELCLDIGNCFCHM